MANAPSVLLVMVGFSNRSYAVDLIHKLRNRTETIVLALPFCASIDAIDTITRSRIIKSRLAECCS